MATPLNLVEKTTDENAAVQTDYSWFTDQVISEVIDDLVAGKPAWQENWSRKAASDYLYNGGLQHLCDGGHRGADRTGERVAGGQVLGAHAH